MALPTNYVKPTKPLREIPYTCVDCGQPKVMVTRVRRSIPKGGLSCGQGPCRDAHNARASR